MEEYIQVTTSTNSEQSAHEILRSLLESRLAACGHIKGPVKSSFWWQGKIDSQTEWVCIIKTRADLFAQVEDLIKTKHSYEVPEILAFPILKVSQAYKDWMEKELKK
jgi:periplasmic divalent cation tolerance protein